ncbi:MAG: hypothetical protein U0930_02170 [Pirellulales bacterium]
MLLVCFVISMGAYWRGQREAAQRVAIESAQKNQIDRLAALRVQLQDGMIYQFAAVDSR